MRLMKRGRLRNSVHTLHSLHTGIFYKSKSPKNQLKTFPCHGLGRKKVRV